MSIGSELKRITKEVIERKEVEKNMFFEEYLKKNEAFLRKKAEEGQYYADLDGKTIDFMDTYGISEYQCQGCKFHRLQHIKVVIWGPHSYKNEESEKK